MLTILAEDWSPIVMSFLILFVLILSPREPIKFLYYLIKSKTPSCEWYK